MALVRMTSDRIERSRRSESNSPLDAEGRSGCAGGDGSRQLSRSSSCTQTILPHDERGCRTSVALLAIGGSAVWWRLIVGVQVAGLVRVIARELSRPGKMGGQSDGGVRVAEADEHFRRDGTGCAGVTACSTMAKAGAGVRAAAGQCSSVV